jgi:hypothetical protein
MKSTTAVLIGLVILLATALWATRQRRQSPPAAGSISELNRLAQEKADLEEALRTSERRTSDTRIQTNTVFATASLAPTIKTAMAELTRLQVPPDGESRVRAFQRVIFLLETLKLAGPAALDEIRPYLDSGSDQVYASPTILARRGTQLSLAKDSIHQLEPLSLRFGLFDVVQQLGGRVAEEILSASLASSPRASEIAHIAFTLEQLAPGQYRGLILQTAHERLSAAANPDPNDPLSKRDRNYLFAVLDYFKDDSYTDQAQTQLISSDGKIDAPTVEYLRKALGTQAVPIIAQAYLDPKLHDPDSKDTLARMALNYVGTNPDANQLFQQAINDPALGDERRKNLIEDLNETGFADPKHLAPSDLPLVENRLALIEQLAPGVTDKVNQAAFAEALKDLTDMMNQLKTHAATEPVVNGPGH